LYGCSRARRRSLDRTRGNAQLDRRRPAATDLRGELIGVLSISEGKRIRPTGEFRGRYRNVAGRVGREVIGSEHRAGWARSAFRGGHRTEFDQLAIDGKARQRFGRGVRHDVQVEVVSGDERAFVARKFVYNEQVSTRAGYDQNESDGNHNPSRMPCLLRPFHIAALGTRKFRSCQRMRVLTRVAVSVCGGCAPHLKFNPNGLRGVPTVSCERCAGGWDSSVWVQFPLCSLKPALKPASGCRGRS
jgi:hypothetical protein